jgi:hypothetical protein
MECLQMFGGLNMGKYQRMTPFVNNSNLTVKHCLHANNVVNNTICDILRKEEVDNDNEVMNHAASIQLMQAYLWKGISAQHILYLLGGLSVVPARFCANSEICIGTNAYKKVKGLLPLASLNKCLHDLAKEQKVSPMVVECIKCEYYCNEGDANLPFDEELSDIKISLRLENKLHHMLCPDVMYYGSRMAQVSPLDHDGSGEKWVLFYCYRRFQLDGSYSDKWLLQHCRPLVEYNLNVNWNDNFFKPILAMELKTPGRHCCCHIERNERPNKRDSLTSVTRRWPCRKSISWTLHLMARITVWPSIGDSTILLREHRLGRAGLECSHHR